MVDVSAKGICTIKYGGVFLLIVTVLAKTCLVRTETEFNFIAAAYRHTQYLSIPSVSSVKCLLVCFSQGHFANPPKSRLEQWHPWRAPIGQWKPGFAPIDYEAHWSVIGHCVGIMSSHGVSKIEVFATSRTTHPIPSHPTHPTHPLYYQY